MYGLCPFCLGSVCTNVMLRPAVSTSRCAAPQGPGQDAPPEHRDRDRGRAGRGAEAGGWPPRATHVQTLHAHACKLSCGSQLALPIALTRACELTNQLHALTPSTQARPRMPAIIVLFPIFEIAFFASRPHSC